MAENEETRGMSLREIVLELRDELKKQNERIAKTPTRTEIYGALGVTTGVVFGIITLL